MKKYTQYICILLILLIALLFRFVGISHNLSFWNDENHTALFSRGILNYGKPVTSIGIGSGIYQIALYYLTALFFKLFGISELIGRLPSVLIGAVLIYFIFIFVNKHISRRSALISSILMGFSQIQLAWSTQLRPYIWLELLALSNVWILTNYLRNKKIMSKYLFLSLLVGTISVLFHGTGLMNIAITLIVFMYKCAKNRNLKLLFGIPIFFLIFILLLYFSLSGNLNSLISVISTFYFSPLHYRIFLTHNYWWLIIGSFFGTYFLYKKNKELALLLSGSILFIFVVAIFKINPNYVRYSLPAFPLMYILFAYGVDQLLSGFTKNNLLYWSLVALMFLFLAKIGKVIFVPKPYYSINADVRENPIVDYKTAFSKISTLIKGKQNVIVMDAWNDRVPWYLPGQKYIFLADPKQFGNPDPVFGEEVMNSVNDFKDQEKKYSSGVVIVEDWESLTPEYLKEYIRKNLKFEFTVQDLPGNENDHWGISVYSWGI